jgi:hypothetical protein
VIAHVVLFEPKSGLAEADREHFLEVLRSAFSGIPSVRRSVVGQRVLIGAGYEAVMGDMPYSYYSSVEFDDTNGLKEYLAHPLHVELGRLFWQFCDRTLILDADCFWLNAKELNDQLS